MDGHALGNKLGNILKRGVLWAATTVFCLSTMSCYTQVAVPYAKRRPVERVIQEKETDVQTLMEQEYTTEDARSFTAYVTKADDPNNPDLEFRMRYNAEGENDKRLYDIVVKEKADDSNEKNLERVGQMLDIGDLVYVRGEYTKTGEYSDDVGPVEIGFMDPFYVGEVDAQTGQTTPIFTESQASKLYALEDEHLVEYLLWEPSGVIIDLDLNWRYYPSYFDWNPSWDWDGDGIMNWRDPWPHSFGPYVDTNHNGRIDAWDIRAGGSWGWYGWYWQDFYHHDMWWHMHDHMYGYGGWNHYWSRPIIVYDTHHHHKNHKRDFTRHQKRFLDIERRGRRGGEAPGLRRPTGLKDRYANVRPDNRRIRKDYYKKTLSGEYSQDRRRTATRLLTPVKKDVARERARTLENRFGSRSSEVTRNKRVRSGSQDRGYEGNRSTQQGTRSRSSSGSSRVGKSQSGSSNRGSSTRGRSGSSSRSKGSSGSRTRKKDSQDLSMDRIIQSSPRQVQPRQPKRTTTKQYQPKIKQNSRARNYSSPKTSTPKSTYKPRTQSRSSSGSSSRVSRSSGSSSRGSSVSKSSGSRSRSSSSKKSSGSRTRKK